MKKLETKKEIKEWFEIINNNSYTINDNLIVDVDGDVDISIRVLSQIPVQFGVINGNFNCNDDNLKSLEGSPEIIKGDFLCEYNQLTSLKGSPKECKNFYCSYNSLTSLKGSPKECEIFDCSENQLKSLNGHPEKCDEFYCYYNLDLTYEYLNNYDFSFVKRNLYTEYKDINKKWNNKIIYPNYISNYF